MNQEIQFQSAYWNNEAESFQKIYSHQKSALANLMDRVFRKDMYERFILTIQNCKPIAGRTFLDVGCGNGLYSIELAKKRAALVVGIDIAQHMLLLCRESAKQQRLERRCTFLHTDLLDYTPESRFDVSFGIGLFDYIRNPLPVLKKMRQVTKDKVVVSFPRFWTWRAPIRKVRLALRGCEVYFYKRTEIDELMRQSGFNRHEVYHVGKLHCVVGFVETTNSVSNCLDA